MPETVTHTPGPWRIDPDFRRILSPQPANNLSGIPGIADIWNWMGAAETDANARLIAAAPELLRAIKDARAYVERAYDYSFPDLDENRRVLNSIDAAIAKAEGRT